MADDKKVIVKVPLGTPTFVAEKFNSHRGVSIHCLRNAFCTDLINGLILLMMWKKLEVNSAAILLNFFQKHLCGFG